MAKKEELIRLIHHHSADQRHTALQHMDGLEEPWVEEHIVAALGDSEWRIRKAAVESLVRRGKPELIKQIVHALRDDENVGRRNAALETLIQIGNPTVDYLIAMLPEEDRDVRKFIVDILGLIGNERTVEPLLDFLTDSDENVRAAGVEYLGKIGNFRAIAPLLDLLQEKNFWLKFAIVTALGEIQNPLVIPHLTPLLQDETLLSPVISALGKMPGIEALSDIFPLLEHKKDNVRKSSLRAVIAIGQRAEKAWFLQEHERQAVRELFSGKASPNCESFLLDCLETHDTSLKHDSIIALGWMQSLRAKEAILAALADERVQDAASAALLAIGRDIVPFLIDNMEDEDERIRISIAMILGELNDTRAERSLIKRLTDDIGHVRAAASKALGHLASIRAIPELVKLLSDEYPDVRDAAVRALVEINGQTIIHDITPLLQDSNKATRVAAVKVFCQLSGPERIHELLFMLKSDSPDVRKTVIDRLRELPQKQVIEPLLFSLTDENPDVRIVAGKALATFEDPRIFESLSKALNDKSIWVVSAILNSAGQLRDERIVDLLLDKLRDDRPIIRIATLHALSFHADDRVTDAVFAIFADRNIDLELRRIAAGVLGKIGDPQTLPELLKAIDHHDWNFRYSVVQALGGFQGEETRDALLQIALSQTEVPLVRQAALASLEHLLNPSVIRKLVTLLQEKTEKIVETACGVLARHLNEYQSDLEEEQNAVSNRFNWLLTRLLAARDLE